MTGEDAADASSVTEKCSPEREEREQEEQAEGKLKPAVRRLRAGKQRRPAWRRNASVAAALKVTTDVFFRSDVKIFLSGADGERSLGFHKTHNTHRERGVCCECMTGCGARSSGELISSHLVGNQGLCFFLLCATGLRNQPGAERERRGYRMTAAAPL